MKYTNSSLVTYTLLSPNYSKRNSKIDTITVHCYVGQVTAERGCRGFAKPEKEASCNYVVGYDGSIGLCVPEEYRSWCSGGSYSVNGITGKMNDHRAVTIEVACEPVHPYSVTPAAYATLIRLVADIAKRNGMGKLTWKANKFLVGKPEEQDMTAHRWFANKACPGQWLYDRMGEIAGKANDINYPTIKPTNEEEIDMKLEEVEALVDKKVQAAIQEERKSKYFNTLADVPECYRGVLSKLMDAGALKGYDGGADGLMATIGDNTIRVDETLCRVMMIMSRPEARVALYGDETTKIYNSVAECPEWSRVAVQWAVDAGIIQGVGGGKLGLDSYKIWSLQVDYNQAHLAE